MPAWGADVGSAPFAVLARTLGIGRGLRVSFLAPCPHTPRSENRKGQVC
jgi:hypothetical protein